MKLSRAECIYLIEKAGMEVKEENAVESLEKAVKLIVNYDAESELRMQRAKEVRKYFDKRKEIQEMQEWMV